MRANRNEEQDFGFTDRRFRRLPGPRRRQDHGHRDPGDCRHDLQLIIIIFEKERMTLRVPVAKAKNSGLRKLSSPRIDGGRAADTSRAARARKRAMWSRRAQEYEAKINSGDPVSIAEVVRDLHRNADQPDQSYSERQIYQAALERLARELAAVEGIDEEPAPAAAGAGAEGRGLTKAAAPRPTPSSLLERPPSGGTPGLDRWTDGSPPSVGGFSILPARGQTLDQRQSESEAGIRENFKHHDVRPEKFAVLRAVAKRIWAVGRRAWRHGAPVARCTAMSAGQFQPATG